MSKTMLTILMGVLVLGISTMGWAADMGTAFTYQGRLSDAGSPAEGEYDFEFKLYTDSTTGYQVGITVTKENEQVSDGLFTVQLNLVGSDPNAFDGDARWLEIGVRPGASVGAFTTLSPRQEVTPTPYALYAEYAETVPVPFILSGSTSDSDAVIEGTNTGDGYGVYGENTTNGAYGLLGTQLDGVYGNGAYGVYGRNSTNNHWGTLGSATYGAYGQHDSSSNYGYLGALSQGVGGIHSSTGNTGYLGTSSYGVGGIHGSSGNYGSLGLNGIGVQGTAVTNGGRGVNGQANATSGINYGVYGETSSSSGYAGYFVGGRNYFEGNVGIGTNSPTAKLTVDGGILREGSTMYGTSADTHINLGTSSITGESESNWAYATVGGGINNTASGASTVGGGMDNAASGSRATVSGGDHNAANAWYATIPGGAYNVAGGSYSFAAGRRAKVRDAAASGDSDGDEGTFIWADSTSADFQSTGPDQFLIRASGGVGIGTNSPGEKLDVDGHINSTQSYKLDGNTVLSNTGTDNIFVGEGAGASNTSGHSNAFVGDNAGTFNTTGSSNTAVGFHALSSNTTGINNVGVGYQANFYNQAGSNNTIIGYRAGRGTAAHNKSGNVFLGYYAGYYETGDNKLYIENSISSSPLIYGEFDNDIVEINGDLGVGRNPATNDLEVEGTASKTTAGDWLANSDARIKTDIQTVNGALETLDKVRLVSFRYTDDYRDEHSSVEDRRYMNVIAQEFREVFPDYVKSSGEKLPDGDEILQVDAYPLTVYSAAAVQELHKIVKDKDVEIRELKDRISKMEALLAKLIHEQEGGVHAQFQD